jgi:hypothetical protein
MTDKTFNDICDAVNDGDYESADSIARDIYLTPEWDEKIEKAHWIKGNRTSAHEISRHDDVYYDELETAIAVHVREILERDVEEGETCFNESDAGPESFGVARHTTRKGNTYWYVCEGGGDNSTWCSLDGVEDMDSWFDDEWDETYELFKREDHEAVFDALDEEKAVSAADLRTALNYDCFAYRLDFTAERMTSAYWYSKTPSETLGVIKANVSSDGLSRRDEAGATLLHYAARKGHAADVDTLLKAGADPCVKDDYGDTPMALAKENNHSACAALLKKAERTAGCEVELCC